ncbi:twin-arginine translocase subunit TatC [Rhodohalobacter sp. SW132]|uniref:twin-arginine translocase subunit TatC n=1 Tax=Rhodohalobacter sp. SW132 TaxID=2293433 RepID=UPI001F4814BD|nr:twin-arginine translocase subunit TatC [Rhodohalobacter sp. SW132]
MSDTPDQDSSKRKIMGALLPKAKAPKIDPTASMSFLDHLEELRWRIIKGLIGVAAGIVIAFIFADFFIQEFILGPARADFFMYQIMPLNAVDLSLISRRLPGQFFTYWGTLIIIGGIIGSPVLFYQLWAFIEPALGSGKKLKTILNALFINFFFLLGISFGYFILVPFAVQFFTQFIISDVISNEFDINEYFTSVALWTLSCGILFQIPVVSYFLSKVGLVTPEGMRAYRRHAIVGALVLSAVLTPPDPVSQLMIAFPLVLLYQFSIVLSRFAHYRRKKELDAALGSGLGD